MQLHCKVFSWNVFFSFCTMIPKLVLWGRQPQAAQDLPQLLILLAPHNFPTGHPVLCWPQHQDPSQGSASSFRNIKKSPPQTQHPNTQQLQAGPLKALPRAASLCLPRSAPQLGEAESG